MIIKQYTGLHGDELISFIPKRGVDKLTIEYNSLDNSTIINGEFLAIGNWEILDVCYGIGADKYLIFKKHNSGNNITIQYV